MGKPNERITIQKGQFVLRYNDQDYPMAGIIEFNWFPSPKVKFKGKSEDKLNWEELFHFSNPSEIRVVLNNRVIGTAMITSFTQSSEISIAGEVQPKIISGDKSLKCQYIHFEVNNLRDFLGTAVKYGEMLTRNRLTFDNGTHIIILDKNTDHKDRQDLLKNDGGYLLNYSGTLEPQNKKGISFDKGSEVLEAFSLFLWFLNGRRTSPLFRKGIFESDTIWTDYTPYITDQFKQVTTWPSNSSIDGISDLWQEFYLLWKNENERECLKTAIHWYVEANGNSGYVEGAIVMVQNALELLYNWLIIEKLKIIKDDDAKNLSAANKIRLLLAQLAYTSEIPVTLHNTIQFIKDNKKDYKDIDGPEIFVRFRNAIVHSHAEKRKTLSSIPNLVRYEILQLGVLYVELILLYILDFKGKYYNRCSRAKWAGEGEEIVPWN